MLHSLFLAVVEAPAAAAHAAHAVAAEPGIVEKFGLEWKYVVVQAISFGILFVVLYWKGIKPTIAAMDERTHQIDAGLFHPKADIGNLCRDKSQLVIIEALKPDQELIELVGGLIRCAPLHFSRQPFEHAHRASAASYSDGR